MLSPCASEDDVEVEVEVGEQTAGCCVVGDQQGHIVVVRDSLVVAVPVMHVARLGVHQDELCVVLTNKIPL